MNTGYVSSFESSSRFRSNSTFLACAAASGGGSFICTLSFIVNIICVYRCTGQVVASGPMVCSHSEQGWVIICAEEKKGEKKW